MTDYKKLCLELFGTDDPQALAKIAGVYHAKNQRNAGRKKKFSREDVQRMRQLRNSGVPVQKIADQYGTSRQVIGKYLNTPPAPGYTLRMHYMYKQMPCTVIDVDFLHQKIHIENQTDDILHCAFGVNETPDWEDFTLFLRSRCFPETRGNAKQLLRQLAVDNYDPLQIIEKTGGRMADDAMHLQIKYYPM